MAENQKKSTKKLAIITYSIAVVCLLAGLLLPFGFKNGEGYNAVAAQLAHALKCFGVDVNWGSPLTYSYPINFWGGNEFELGGLLILLYALVCLASIGVLIAVILGNKEKDTSLNSACVLEVVSTIVVAILLYVEMATFSLGGYADGYVWSIALSVAFGGPLIMLFIQSIYHKGASGAVKMIIVLLGIISVVFCLFSLSGIIPKLAELLKLSNTQIIGWTADGREHLGSVWYHLYLPFHENYGAVLKELGGMGATVSVLMLVLGVLITVNFILDVCGLVKTTKRWMLLANLIRYGLEVLLVLAVLLLGGVVEKHGIGIICYVLLGLAVVATLINVIRFVKFKDEKAEETAAEENTEEGAQEEAEAAAEEYAEEGAQPQQYEQAYEQPYDQPYEGYENYSEPYQPQQHEQPQAQKPQYYNPQQTAAPVASQDGNVYSPVIYNGPRDAFIDTLSNEQRIEFARLFLERRNGNIEGVPEYVVNGDNEKFFQSLFIYYARVRGHVSDGLMNKFYTKVKSQVK